MRKDHHLKDSPMIRQLLNQCENLNSFYFDFFYFRWMKNVKLLENRRQASKRIDENKRKNKKIMNNHQHRHWTMQNDEIQKHLVYKIQSKLNKIFDGILEYFFI